MSYHQEQTLFHSLGKAAMQLCTWVLTTNRREWLKTDYNDTALKMAERMSCIVTWGGYTGKVITVTFFNWAGNVKGDRMIHLDRTLQCADRVLYLTFDSGQQDNWILRLFALTFTRKMGHLAWQLYIESSHNRKSYMVWRTFAKTTQISLLVPKGTVNYLNRRPLPTRLFWYLLQALKPQQAESLSKLLGLYQRRL